MAVKVLRCRCKNDWQDKEYGSQMRVMNQTTKESGKVYRCTSCKLEHKSGGD